MLGLDLYDLEREEDPKWPTPGFAFKVAYTWFCFIERVTSVIHTGIPDIGMEYACFDHLQA